MGVIDLKCGDMLEELEKINENSIDSIITDPPYELNFMNKGWDNAGISFNKETWGKCLRVLKPGGYLLAFGGSRTFHRIACAIEDAGFEIRDTIMWLYGSGFPKSQNIGLMIDKRNGIDNRTGNIVEGMGSNNTESLNNHQYETQNFKKQYEKREAQNEWKGWGTCLKPSFEPIIIARKPFKGTLVDNVIKWGVGGLNIDECRVGTGTGNTKPEYKPNNKNNVYGKGLGGGDYENTNGRFPANTILTYDQITFDEVCGGFPNAKDYGGKPNYEKSNYKSTCDFLNGKAYKRGIHYAENGSASRYFYCAKASKKDRDEGLENFIEEKVNDGRNKPIDNAFQRGETLRKNTHPTVKPTELMQYLVRLVNPKGATILDPFMGSGSTGKAVMYENKERNVDYSFIGIELNQEYFNIAKERIKNTEV